MLFQEFFQFGKRVLEIDEDDDITGSVHATEKTVFAVEDTVSRAGGIVEVVIPEVLADGRAFKYGGPCVSCKDQGRDALLKAIALAGTVEHVLIVVDGNDRRLRVPCKDTLRQWMIYDLLFDIDMRERKVK